MENLSLASKLIEAVFSRGSHVPGHVVARHALATEVSPAITKKEARDIFNLLSQERKLSLLDYSKSNGFDPVYVNYEYLKHVLQDRGILLEEAGQDHSGESQELKLGGALERLVHSIDLLPEVAGDEYLFGLFEIVWDQFKTWSHFNLKLIERNNRQAEIDFLIDAVRLIDGKIEPIFVLAEIGRPSIFSERVALESTKKRIESILNDKILNTISQGFGLRISNENSGIYKWLIVEGENALLFSDEFYGIVSAQSKSTSNFTELQNKKEFVEWLVEWLGSSYVEKGLSEKSVDRSKLHKPITSLLDDIFQEEWNPRFHKSAQDILDFFGR